ncbi:hypothetical protein HK101_004798, partial [Irineochytrium annulatum]
MASQWTAPSATTASTFDDRALLSTADLDFLADLPDDGFGDGLDLLNVVQQPFQASSTGQQHNNYYHHHPKPPPVDPQYAEHHQPHQHQQQEYQYQQPIEDLLDLALEQHHTQLQGSNHQQYGHPQSYHHDPHGYGYGYDYNYPPPQAQESAPAAFHQQQQQHQAQGEIPRAVFDGRAVAGVIAGGALAQKQQHEVNALAGEWDSPTSAGSSPISAGGVAAEAGIGAGEQREEGALEELNYITDETGTILSITDVGDWNRFIERNADLPLPANLRRCLCPAIIGRNLFEFMGGEAKVHAFARHIVYMLVTGQQKRFQ